MHISQVIIRNFKSFGSDSVTFQDTFVAIVGPNGSGKSNLLDAICFALGVESKRLRISNYSELIPGDKILEKILPYVKVVLLEGKGRNAQKITVESQLIRLNSNSFSVRHQLNGRLITKQELIRQLLSHGLNIKEPVFILQQSTATLDLLKGGPYLLELCMTAAGVKSCFDGAAFAKMKLHEWEKGYQEISANIEQLQANLDEHTSQQKEVYQLGELLDRIKSLERKAEKMSAQNDIFRMECVKIEISKLSDSEQELLASLDLLSQRKVGLSNNLLELKERMQLNTKEIEKQNEQCRDFENNKLLTDERFQKHQQQLSDIQREKEGIEATIKHNKTLLILETRAQSIALEETEQTQSLIDRFSLEGEAALRKNRIEWLESKIEQCDSEERLINRSKEGDGVRCDPQEIRLSLAQTESEIARKEAKIKNLKLQIQKLEGKSHPNKIRALQEMESSIVGEINVASRKLMMSKGKELSPKSALDVFVFLPEAESYLPALAAIITGKNSRIVETSLEAKSIARSSSAPIWILDRLQDVAVNRKKQEKIQSQYPEEVVIPQDLISYEPKYQKVVNRLFGSWMICKTQAVAEKVLNKFQERSVACDSLSLISKGSMTGGFRRFGDFGLKEKFSRDAAGESLRVLQERYSSFQTEKEVLLKEFEDLKSQRLCLEEEVRALETLSHKKKTQNEALRECVRENLILENDSKQIASRIESVRIERGEFEDQKEVVRKLSPDSLKSFLHERDILLGKKLFSLGEQIVQLESRLSFMTQQIESLEKLEKEELDQSETHERLYQTACSALQRQVEHLKSLNLNRVELEEQILLVEETMAHEKLRESNLKDKLRTTQGEVNTFRKERISLERKIDEAEVYAQEIGEWESREDIEEEIRKLKVERELLEEKRSARKPKEPTVTRNLLNQMEEIEKHRTQMVESIEKLKSGLKSAEDIAQKNLEETFLELQGTVTRMYQSLVPSKRVKLEKRGELLQDGIEVKVANVNEDSETAAWQSDSKFLSGGQQALLAVTITLAALRSSKANIQFLILDEVDAAMDEQNSQAVAKLLSAPPLGNCQVLSVSHHASFFKEAKQLISVGKKGRSSIVLGNNLH